MPVLSVLAGWVAVCVLAGSCQKNFLNKQPLDQYSDVNVWVDSALITRYVDDIYANLITVYDYAGYTSFITQGMIPADLTDEAKSNFPGSTADLVNLGQYDASSNIFELFFGPAPAVIFVRTGCMRTCGNATFSFPTWRPCP